MGEYVEIDGHPTWVEVTGDGPPVVLLHGGFSNSDTMLEAFAPLGGDFRLVAFDRRGHGRTADVDRAFHYADMADETIGVLETVVGGPAHLLGYSDGANAALLVALARPDLVQSLVLIGANYRADGLVPGAFDDFDLESELGAQLVAEYGARSPDGAEHFPVIAEKAMDMMIAEPTMTPDELTRIAVPALVLVGDDDLMTLAHTCSLYESLAAGQLAVVPGASHLVPLEKPALVNQLVSEFLAGGGETETLMPLRRG